MSIHNFINEYIILSVFDLYKGLNIRRYLSLLFRSQSWTKTDLIKFQNVRLRKLLEHAYKNVPFYTDIFDNLGLKPDDIKGIEDLKLLPVLNKNDIRTNIQNGKLIARNFRNKDLIRNSSSGSTGEPLQFYMCKNSESMKKASAIRGWYWMGYRLGDKILRVGQIERKGKLKKLQDFFNRSYYLHVPIINDEAFHLLCKKILKQKPKILRIYPDPLNYLVDFVEKNKIQINFIKAINTTGSILSNEVREKAVRIFNCEVFDSFSCEGGAVVFEGPERNCYFSAMEYAVTEVLDTNNQQTFKGRLITTDLWNYATPFIRYDTQDVIELYDSIIDSNINLLQIKSIFGRESDILITPNGQLLVVNNFTGLLQGVVGLEQFQIHQTKENFFDVYIKCNNNILDYITNEVTNILFNIFPKDAIVNIKIVNDIPTEKSGKRRFLIRDKNIQLP